MKSCSSQLATVVIALWTVSASATVRYVDSQSASPAVPYTSWATAATNIQDAIDASVTGDQILVTNGVYRTGGRLMSGPTTNRVAVYRAVTLQSVNGPAATVIEGYQVPGTTNGPQAVRCVYLADGAVLIGFTLTNGGTAVAFTFGEAGGGAKCDSASGTISNCVFVSNAADGSGGGVVRGTLNDCTLVGNYAGSSGGGADSSTLNNCLIADNRARSGGGTLNATLKNCTISNNVAFGSGGGILGSGGGILSSKATGCWIIANHALNGGGAAMASQASPLTNCILLGNVATSSGGGAYQCPLYNCTVVSNSAVSGGGVQGNTPINSIIYYNSAPNGANWMSVQMANCCTVPAQDATSFTNAPLFVDLAGGDFHLQTNSPCINSGRNSYAGITDADGNPRIAGGTVDVGAYEFQSPASVLAYVWAQQYGLPTDGSADYTDPDGDGANNWQEWISGTVPIDSASVLKLFTPSKDAPGVKVSWQSVDGKTYFLQRSSNLVAPPPFSVIQSNIAATGGTTTFTDGTATNVGPYFYRVGVQ
jgi:hypothetical protein